MARAWTGAVGRQLLGAAADQDLDGQTDGALLRAFVDAGDQRAFETLVRRHGPMVLGVGLRALGSVHDAEDTLQGTFIVLAQRAASIRRRESLASWLHGVAHRMVTHARRARGRRRGHEARAAAPPPADPALVAAWQELQALVDAEIAALPETLRGPFVACCLENRGGAETAAALGVREDAVRQRVSRARERLRDRLARRGVVPTVALTAVALAGAAPAAVPRALAAAAARAAGAAADGRGLAGCGVPADVLSLVAGVNRAMALTRTKTAALLLAAGLLAGGAGLLAAGGPPPRPPAAGAPKQPTEEAKGRAAPADRDGAALPPGALLRFSSTRLQHDGIVRASALSPDGATLATASDRSVVLWDLGTGKAVRRWACDGHTFSRPGLAFSPDGRHLGYVMSPEVACVWEVAGGREVARFAGGDRRRAYALCHFTPDGTKFVLYDGPDRLVFWDVRANKEARAVRVEGVSLLAPDGRSGVRVDTTGAVAVVDARTGTEARRLDTVAEQNGVRDGVAFSPDGGRLAVVHGNKEVQVRDFPGGAVRASFPLPESARYEASPGRMEWEYRVGFSADGQTLLLGTHGGQAYAWDLASKTALPPMTKHVRSVAGVHVLPDRKTAVTTGEDGTIRRWELATGRELAEPPGYAGRLHAAYAPDGRLAAAGDGRGRLELWDARTGEMVRALRREGPAVARLCFSADSKSLAGALADGTVRVWSVPDGAERTVLRCDGQDLSLTRALAVSPDGGRVLVCDLGSRLRLWDAASAKVVWGGEYAAAALSPDGSAVVAQSGGFHVLAASDGTPRHKLPVSPTGVGSLGIAVSPDGRVAVGYFDGAVDLYRPTRAGGVVTRFQAVRPPKGALGPRGRSPVEGVAFSPDGRWVCTTGNDGTVRLWEAATGQEVLQLAGHVRAAGDVSFGADGRTVLTCGEDAQAYLWSLRPPAGGEDRPALEALWAALAGEPAAAYRAVWQMAGSEGVPAFLRGTLAPARPVAAARLGALIAALDGGDFATVGAATRELAGLGHAAVPAMRGALADRLPLEQRRRLEVLVDQVESRAPSADELRAVRAVDVLERQGTAEAVSFLRSLAGGAPGVPVTAAAQGAVARLTARVRPDR